MKTSEVLNKAADLIEKRGWVSGTGWDGDGPLCMEGGIAAVVGVDTIPGTDMVNTAALTRCPAYKAVADYLEAAADLWEWNDAPGRTAAEVVEVLRATAVIEAARETPAGIFRMGDITATIPAQVAA